MSLESMFELRKNNTTVKQEVLAGVATGLTMMYICIVNPLILEAGGAPFPAVFTATIVSAAVACFVMGFWANWPIGLASGMGLNAFVAFAVCGAMGYSYEEALGACFVAGVIFLALTLTGVRETLVNAIPHSLKLAIGAAIGGFLAMIGFQIGGITVNSDATLVTLGNIKDPTVILCLLGVASIIILDKLKVTGGLIITLLGLSIIGWVTGLQELSGFVSTPPPMSLLFAMDVGAALSIGMLSVVGTLLFVDFTDTSGTLVSCANLMKKVDNKGKVKGIGRAMMADAVGTVVGAAAGTTTVTSYIESGAGIKQGGKTGLTAVTVGCMFLLALFFSPIAISIPKWADAPVLIAVGFMFLEGLKNIDWSDVTESSPALLAVFAVPYTYSIAVGIQLAFLTYILAKWFTGRSKDLSAPVYVIGAACLVAFLI